MRITYWCEICPTFLFILKGTIFINTVTLSQYVEQVQQILGQNAHSRFDILTHISQRRPVMPVHFRLCQHSFLLCAEAPFNLPQLCILTYACISFLHLRGAVGPWARSLGQLALSVSMVFSNQHIPLFLDRHRETILAAHTQGGVMLISCPLTSDYTHTHTQLLYCFFCSMLTLKNTTFSHSAHAAFSLFWTSCHSRSLNPEALSVFLPTASPGASVAVPIRARCTCPTPTQTLFCLC